MSGFDDDDYILDGRVLDHLGKLESKDVQSVDNKGDAGGAVEPIFREEENEEESDEASSPIVGRLSDSTKQLERLRCSDAQSSDEVCECLEACADCYQTCTETIAKCLTMGGVHSDPRLINLMTDCATICITNINFILRSSTYYPQTCDMAVGICDECGDECDKFEEDFMKQCAAVCQRCAETCCELAR